ncbi:M81 family metallopeptidase [Tautonia sociabilis]|uniref:M81 family peptidase n=1 Tax=Tautonia sociabilis TaxID=2080755 RepID=A0A432MFC9_9BACT|nr:M81 family metallopeptidase [Tautonia sociabilis]RUL84677.1 M81 family peptidase [Tautonia sociabilis]
MRIAVGGLMHESNTFSGSRTTLDDFRAGSLADGDALVPIWRDAHHEVGGFLEGASRFGFEAVPTTMAWATPGGPVDDAVLDEVVARIASALRREPVDGLLLALHGAMVTPNHPDADGEVLRRLREAVGPKFPIVASLDFHANVSPAMAEHADALVGYQTYPHIDQRERGVLAARLASAIVRGDLRPSTALVSPPMVINLLGQETDREPMRSLMELARSLEARPGIATVSVMAGFPYADVPEMGPSIIAVSDDDPDLARDVAAELGERMWSIRRALDVRSPDAAEAVRQAIASDRPPVVLVDLGDNIGGGTPGDGTVLLAELIRQGARDAIVVLHDPEAAAHARALGPGGRFERAVGGRGIADHGGPVAVSGEVRSLHDGTWVEDQARHGGRRLNDQGPTAVVELPGPITLVLNTLRTPPFSLGQLTSLGLDPAAQRILVAKAAVAYKAAYGPIAGEIIPVDTPGITAIDPRRFAYRHIRRPIFPMDEE